jgi:hypothetical protein
MEHRTAGDPDAKADLFEGGRAEAAFAERGQRRPPDGQPGFLGRCA